MNIEIRYQSRGGNTKAVAETIAKKLKIEAKDINEKVNEYVDILFVGGGVYGWDADKKLVEFLNKLDPSKVGTIVAFSTSGSMKSAINRIKKCANKLGIKVANNNLLLKMGAKGHAALGRKGGILTEEQVEKINQFVKDVTKELK